MLILEKSIATSIQASIVQIYDDATPWVNLNALSILFCVFINATIPILVATFKPQRLLTALLFLTALLIFYKILYTDLFSSFATFFCLYILGSTGQTLSQILINSVLNDGYRSTFQGFYNSFYNLSLAIGPFLSAVLTPSYSLELNLFFLAGLLGIAFLWQKDKNEIDLKPKKIEGKLSFKRKLMSSVDVFMQDRFFFLLSLTTCLNMSMVVHLLVFWGKTYALSIESSKLLPTIFSLGGVFLPIPLGYLSDKIGLLRLYFICLIIMIGSFFLLSFDFYFGVFDLIALFLIGGCVATLISLSFSYIGKKYSGSLLTKSTASITFMKLTFSIIGLYISGEIIDRLNASNFNLMMCGLNIILGILLYKEYRKTKPLPEK